MYRYCVESWDTVIVRGINHVKLSGLYLLLITRVRCGLSEWLGALNAGELLGVDGLLASAGATVVCSWVEASSASVAMGARGGVRFCSG